MTSTVYPTRRSLRARRQRFAATARVIEAALSDRPRVAPREVAQVAASSLRLAEAADAMERAHLPGFTGDRSHAAHTARRNAYYAALGEWQAAHARFERSL